MSDQGDLFGHIRGMVRRGDPFTSYNAAEGVSLRASKLHAAITQEIAKRGPMTDQELEDLPIFFPRYAYSTVRKRRTELYQRGCLVSVGSKINRRKQRMLIWDLVGRVHNG